MIVLLHSRAFLFIKIDNTKIIILGAHNFVKIYNHAKNPLFSKYKDDRVSTHST